MSGSFQFDDFINKDQEIAILKRQAEMALHFDRQIWQNTGLKAGMTVLDLACGLGMSTCELAQIVQDGCAVGVDLSDGLLVEAQKIASQQGVDNCQFIQADVYDLKLEGEVFDYAYARFLFQHLKSPELALQNVAQSMTSGGTLCVVDVDDQWFSLSPEPKSFAAFVRETSAFQLKNGGNRFIGHDLGKMFHDNGFVNVKTDVMIVTSEMVPMPGFLDLTVKSKIEQMSGAELGTIQPMVDDIYQLCDLDYAWGGVGVFVVTGEKE